jgi:hypothetical protein
MVRCPVFINFVCFFFCRPPQSWQSTPLAAMHWIYVAHCRRSHTFAQCTECVRANKRESRRAHAPGGTRERDSGQQPAAVVRTYSAVGAEYASFASVIRGGCPVPSRSVPFRCVRPGRRPDGQSIIEREGDDVAATAIILSFFFPSR